MKKIMFFPLWKTEKIEQFLEDMEQKGYRLIKVRYSYWFLFKESTPKEMHYFLSYKSFRGPSMGYCDYALASKHSANPVDTHMCYFLLYRTKEPKDKLSLLYEVKMDYLKRILLEKALTTTFLTVLFSLIIYADINTIAPHKFLWIIFVLVSICTCMMIRNFFGFFKQRTKCKEYERKNKLDCKLPKDSPEDNSSVIGSSSGGFVTSVKNFFKRLFG